MSDFKEYIEDIAKLLPLNSSISYTDAEKRASKFLEAQAMITNWLHMIRDLKIKSISIQTATFAVEMSKGTDKTVTANKVAAEASESYTRAREDVESLDNDISYLKAYYEIFNNAHLFFRQMSKEGRS